MLTLLRRCAVLLLTTAVAIGLSSCGGDEEGGGGSATPPPQGLSLSGSPPTVTLQGRVYSFQPTASAPNGSALTFSIANAPPWATFNPVTGQIVGTPTQVGSFDNITITARSGSASASLGPFGINVTAVASGSAILSWLPPLQNTDGSPLTNLQGYRVRFGTQFGDYPNAIAINSPGLASYVVDQLTPATWFFVITAVNSNGVESQFSNPASKVVR